MNHARSLPRIIAVTLLTLVAAFSIIIVGPSTTPASADLDDFTFDSYHADFTLGRDVDGRSTLHTSETFVARFPEFDQNRGFIRAIPRVYNGFALDITELSVTDENGEPRPFEVETAGDSLDVIMAVPEGSFVRGEQTYVLDYWQQDVTAYFEDTDSDEFYWDLNGTDTRQPFGEVSASVTLEDGLAEHLNGDSACYRGTLGSDTACAVHIDAGVFSVAEQGLGPGENVSIAVGFHPETFAPAPESNRVQSPPTSDVTGTQLPAFLQLGNRFGGAPVFLWGAIACVGAAVSTFIVSRVRRGRANRTGRAIIAQYDPPKGVSVAVAADLMRAPKKAMTATLLDLAVRRKLKLLHGKKSNRYGVQATTSDELLPVERRVYDRLFGFTAKPGEVLWFDKKSPRLGDAAAELRGEARRLGSVEGYYAKPKRGATIGIILLAIAAFGLLTLHATSIWGFVALIIVVVAGGNLLMWFFVGVAAFFRSGTPPLTHAGAALREHLLGLKEFIRLAEADRIRMLQSASGAEVTDEHVVQLYERLLPYAVIFDQEEEWQGELARYYHEQTPEWVQGDGIFSQAIQVRALQSVVASSPVTKVASSGGSGFSSRGSFSSSRGGSSGGGFSGGGGGGGGTRGI